MTTFLYCLCRKAVLNLSMLRTRYVAQKHWHFWYGFITCLRSVKGTHPALFPPLKRLIRVSPTTNTTHQLENTLAEGKSKGKVVPVLN